MMEKDLVSIIMPNFNATPYIEKAIKSVINQTYSNWELIIVDDNSSDKSAEIIEDFCSNDSRIHLIKNEKRLGTAQSRNIALERAIGKWIAFLDSDDLWANNKLEIQIDFMKRNNYLFSCTKYSIIDELGNQTGVEVSSPRKINRLLMRTTCYIGCLTVIYSSQIGKFYVDSKIIKRNDYAMWLKISKITPCFLLPINLALYRKHNNSLSSGKKTSLFRHHYILFRNSEKCNPFASLFLAVTNVVFYFIKRILYVKKI